MEISYRGSDVCLQLHKFINPIALEKAKTPKSFCLFEGNMVKEVERTNELKHELSKNVVCVTSKGSLLEISFCVFMSVI